MQNKLVGRFQKLVSVNFLCVFWTLFCLGKLSKTTKPVSLGGGKIIIFLWKFPRIDMLTIKKIEEEKKENKCKTIGDQVAVKLIAINLYRTMLKKSSLNEKLLTLQMMRMEKRQIRILKNCQKILLRP